MSRHSYPYLVSAASPSRPGVYPVRTPRPEREKLDRFSLWDGAKWHACSRTMEGAATTLSISGFMYEHGARWADRV